MDSNSDGNRNTKRNNSLWNKLTQGISASSKSISKTPAQDRLSRLRKNLVEEQKKKEQNAKKNLIETIKSELVQQRSTNNFGVNSLLAQQKSKLKKNNLEERLKRCREKPQSTLPSCLIPATEVCNQLSQLKSSKDLSSIEVPHNNTSTKLRGNVEKNAASATSTEISGKITKSSSTLTKFVTEDKEGANKPPQSTLKDITEEINLKIEKSRKRKSKESEESIQEKILKKNTETQLRLVKDAKVTKKISANDRLQRFRDALKRTKDKNATETTPIRPSTKSTNESETKPKIDPSGNPQSDAGILSTVEQMDVDDDPPLFQQPQKTEPPPSTSVSSCITSFFQSFRNEIANVFTSHAENINIREKYNKTINEMKLKKEDSKKDCIYVIPDTNIFIHHLTFIKDILEQPMQKNKIVRIYVPYIVIEELDRLKEQKDKSVSTTAMRAVKYLNEKLENQDASLRGQTIVDYMDHVIPVKYPDDSILNCCLQMKRNGKRFVLLSNDINLRNKALVNSVKAFSSSDVEVDNIAKFC